MKNTSVLVIGATGDVGRGIVAAALESGRKVVASGRNREKLDLVAPGGNDGSLTRVVGDIGTEAAATELWNSAEKAAGQIGSVVVTVSTPMKKMSLTDWSIQDLDESIASNINLHLIAARVFQPRLPEGGLLIGIGGGAADFVIPKMVHASMIQAAQRMLYKGLCKERKSGAELRELIIVSMVAGESNRNHAQPDWLTDVEIGRHVCAILDEPESFSDSILYLKSRAQVGKPEKRA